MKNSFRRVQQKTTPPPLKVPQFSALSNDIFLLLLHCIIGDAEEHVAFLVIFLTIEIVIFVLCHFAKDTYKIVVVIGLLYMLNR